MSKLSDQIRKQAKEDHRSSGRSHKLTEHQNGLARQHGYKNLKHLVNQEKAREAEERTQFAEAGLSDKTSPIDALLPDKISVFVRKDGRRGLKALTDFKSGDVLIREQPFLWFGIQEDALGLGLSWGLTRNIAIKFPEALSYLQSSLKLRESFRPKLTGSDRKILRQISEEARLPLATVRSIYNLVCTYNVISWIEASYDDQVLFGARISISVGLAYANHSCAPNSARLETGSIDSFKANVEGLKAIKDIQAGEEISWSYFRGTIPSSLKERQKTLKREFDFRCNCSRCMEETRRV